MEMTIGREHAFIPDVALKRPKHAGLPRLTTRGDAKRRELASPERPAERSAIPDGVDDGPDSVSPSIAQ